MAGRWRDKGIGASFYFLWGGQSLANLGNALYLMAIISMVFEMTKSATLAAAVTLFHVTAKWISGFCFPLWSDRWRLRSLLLVSQGVQTILLAGAAWYAGWGFADPTVALLLWVAAISFMDGWTVPARNALIPRLVPAEQLARANSMISTTDQTLLLLGWSLGGLLVARVGGENLLWGVVGLFAVSSACLLRVRNPGAPRREKKIRPLHSKWASVKEGWLLLYRRPRLRLLTAMEILEGFGGSIWIGGITLVFVQEVLHRGKEWWGYINAGYYAGTIIGGLLIWWFSGWVQKRLFPCIVIGSLSYGLFTFLYAWWTVPMLSLMFVVCMGPGWQLREIAQKTFYQRHVEEHLLPKVMASQSTLSYTVFGISVLITGWMADTLGVRTVYFFAAGMSLLSSLFGLAAAAVSKGDEPAHPGERDAG